MSRLHALPGLAPTADPILSDAQVAARLKLADVAPSGKTAALHRAARVVALVVGAALTRQRRFEATRNPWEVEVPLDLEELAGRTGLPLAQVEEAAHTLREGGVWDELARSGSRRVRFVPEVFAEAGEVLAWPEIVDELAGDAAALLVCRTLADRLAPGYGEWRTLSRGEIASRSAYGVDTVRRAVGVLVGAGVLLERRAEGRESRYAFSEFARGLAGRVAPAQAATAAPVEVAPQPVVPATPPTVTQAADSMGQGIEPLSATTIVVGGVSISVQPGMHLDVSRDATGGLRVSIR